jgi:hypothetical protein
MLSSRCSSMSCEPEHWESEMAQQAENPALEQLAVSI